MHVYLEVSLDNVDKVKEFIATSQSIPVDMQLRSGKYVVDAKSILGVFSLDLSHSVILEIEDSNEDASMYEAIFSKFIKK